MAPARRPRLPPHGRAPPRRRFALRSGAASAVRFALPLHKQRARRARLEPVRDRLRRAAASARETRARAAARTYVAVRHCRVLDRRPSLESLSWVSRRPRSPSRNTQTGDYTTPKARPTSLWTGWL